RREAGGASPAGARLAHRAGAAAVATGGDVEEVRDVSVGVARVVGAVDAVESVNTRDERARRAGATDDDPAARAGVVDGEAGIRVGDRRDVGRGALRAGRLRLVARLRLEQAARAAGAAPRGLGPAARAGRRLQAGAADGGDAVRSARIVGRRTGVAVVAAGHEDGDARVREVLGIIRQIAAVRRAAPAVADDVRAQARRPVLAVEEPKALVVRREDEDDFAVRASGAGHIEVEGRLDRPIIAGRCVAWERGCLPILVLDLEAAVRLGAGRQAELAAVYLEVALGVRVVEGVDDGDGAAGL